MSDAVRWTRQTPAELADKLTKQPFVAEREQLMQKITFVVLGNAQQRTPVRTGTLRRSETTRVEQGGLRGYVGTNVVYAPFVHRRIPFFADALEASRPAIDRLLEQAGDAYLQGLT